MVLSDNKDLDGANTALDKATKLKPDFALAWNRLGRVALKRGEVVPAVAAQEKARKLEPKNGAFAADLCRALIEQKQAAKAVPECKAAVDLDPKNPLAHYELMKALVAKGDCAGAKSANASFKALPVKPEAKAQADAILATCKK
jgi:predicted Zn-dependent protease